MTKLLNTLGLTLAIMAIILGAGLIKSFYNEFSVIDGFLIQDLLSLFGGSFLVANGIKYGYRFFINTKNS